jgi:integrase
MGFKGAIEEKCTKLYQFTKKHKDPNVIQSYLIKFINYQKQRIENKEISEGTLVNYIKAIKLFYSMNDIIINWKKIDKGVPSERHNAEYRIPTWEEIRKLLEHPDRRVKPIVCTMLSAGIRVGSWNHLKWKHIISIKRNNVVVAARIIPKNTKINNREYYSFITPEAYNALKDWMEFRKLHGENVTGESWLMRDTWEKIDRDHSHRIGLAKYPKKFGGMSIGNMIGEAWRIQGVRDLLDPAMKIKRHEFKSTHCFRKFFETRCQSKMNHNHIKLLMDHSLGESQNYHRPTEQELLDDYLHAVNNLTINEENRLKMKVELLEHEKTNYEKLDAKIDALQREFYRNKVRTEWAGLTKDDLSEDVIEQKIQERRMLDNARRQSENEIWEQIEKEESRKKD